MAYTNSSLVNYTLLSPNYSKGRKCINRITIHHMAGNLSVERCGQVFANKSRQASSNYGIGTDGRIGLYVSEANRSWCSSNGDNDRMAVTIEVADTTKGVTNKTWEISDKAYQSLINLCADICRRNGYTSVMSIDYLVKGTIAQKTKIANTYVAPKGTLILTQHNYFASTACPADYIKKKWNNIVSDINKAIGGVTPKPQPIPSDIPNENAIILGKYYCKSVMDNSKIDMGYVFNPTWYANHWADLKSAFGYDDKKLFEHFCTHGMYEGKEKEGRQASANFNPVIYRKNYPSLEKNFGTKVTDNPKYYEHYCRFGYNEGRKTI